MEKSSNNKDNSIKNMLRTLKANATQSKNEKPMTSAQIKDKKTKKQSTYNQPASLSSSSSSTSLSSNELNEDNTTVNKFKSNLMHPFLVGSFKNQISGKQSQLEKSEIKIDISDSRSQCSKITNSNENVASMSLNANQLKDSKLSTSKFFKTNGKSIPKNLNENNHNSTHIPYQDYDGETCMKASKNANQHQHHHHHHHQSPPPTHFSNSTHFNECISDSIKKLSRGNKANYNGFLYNKLDCLNRPEYQAHAAELLYFLKSQWQNQKMCDLSFVIGNRKYLAHKLSLAMFSRKYYHEFEKRQSNEMVEICLQHTTNMALESILKYIYTAKIDINPANAEEILEGAKELGVDDLISMTSDYLSSLSIGDVLEYMGNVLNKEGSELMFYELYAYIMTHLDKVSRTPEYLKSNAFVVKTLLNDSHLSVKSELDVFDAALRWIDFDRVHRIKYLSDIMKTIRFTLMSPDEIVSKVEIHSMILDDADAYKMLYNSFKYHALNNKKSKLTSIIKREEDRNACLKGASVPDDFVKATIQLSEIAHHLKKTRNFTTNNIISYNFDDGCNINNNNNNNNNNDSIQSLTPNDAFTSKKHEEYLTRYKNKQSRDKNFYTDQFTQSSISSLVKINKKFPN